MALFHLPLLQRETPVRYALVVIAIVIAGCDGDSVRSSVVDEALLYCSQHGGLKQIETFHPAVIGGDVESKYKFHCKNGMVMRRDQIVWVM